MIAAVTQAGQMPALDRSYLISPEKFHVVNRQLALMVFDSKHSRELTASIMKFLTKLVAHDYHFAALILGTLDLRKFLEVNLLTEDQAHIQASVEFLRCFQSEARFAHGLFEILIDLVQTTLPAHIPPQKGYEAIIGMLGWALPLDAERTLRVLYSTLYNTICKGSLPGVQSSECVDFRTRYALPAKGESEAEASLAEHFPFDAVLLRPLSSATGRAPTDSGSSGPGRQDGRGRPPGASGLLKSAMEVVKSGQAQTFVAKFERATCVEVV